MKLLYKVIRRRVSAGKVRHDRDGLQIIFRCFCLEWMVLEIATGDFGAKPVLNS